MFNQDPQYQNIYNKSFEQQLQTNKWKVQNLQDALNRYAPPNSCGCYYCMIDGVEYEYEVFVDAIGQKTYKVYKRQLCENNTTQNDPVLTEILNRLKHLEDTLGVKPTTIEPSTTTL